MGIRGFTLVELMIALAVIGILAAIAYPSYQQSVIRSRRAAAQGCLVELGQWMERFHTTNMAYHQDSGGAAVALPATQCRTEIAASYTISFNGNPTAATYALQAVGQGGQTADSCGTLGINQFGAKTPATAGCWPR